MFLQSIVLRPKQTVVLSLYSLWQLHFGTEGILHFLDALTHCPFLVVTMLENVAIPALIELHLTTESTV